MAAAKGFSGIDIDYQIEIEKSYALGALGIASCILHSSGWQSIMSSNR